MLRIKKLILTALAAAILLSAAGCGKKEDIRTENPGVNVTVSTVGSDFLENNVSYTGELKTADDTSITPKISAKIAKVNAEEGDFVKAGDVLCELDATDMQNAYNTALAGYNSALAGYNAVVDSQTKQASTNAKNALTSAQLAYNQALENYDREKQLYETGSQVRLAEQSYNDAVKAYEREKELYEADSTLKTAEQAYNNAVSAYEREKELYDNDTSLVSIQNSLSMAEDTLNSTQALYDIGAASKVELDNARSNVENLRANLATVRSQRQASYDGSYTSMVNAEENYRKARLNAKTPYDAAYTAMVNAEENLKTVRLSSSAAYTAARNALENAQNALSTAQQNIGLTDVSNKSSVATANASLESAKTALKTATDNLNNTKIRALSSGYVATKNATVGAMAAAGTPLFTIKNTDQLMAEIEVTESVIPYITTSTRAVVDVSSADRHDMAGVVTLVNPTKNEKTGMYTVQVNVTNRDGALNAGMFADVKLAIQESPNAITVPNGAIMQEGDKLYVYTASLDGKKAEKHVVSTGIESDDYTEILSGISIGDKVIVTGQDYLTDENLDINIVTE